MELVMRQFRWQEQFHGIPWNFKCANFDDTSSSMEFHGTRSAPISLTLEVPWNSMELGVRQFRWHEKFHGIPLILWCANFDDTSSSMEFHGIQWNFECTNFADTGGSMEFHGTLGAPISLTRAVPWNSMEFHGTQGAPISLTRAVPWNSIPWTWSVPLSLTREVPWNSMGLGVRQFCWHEQFHGFPWNSMELGMRQFQWQEQFHGIPWN